MAESLSALPLAEELSPGALLERGQEIADSARPNVQYDFAWTNIELGIVTKNLILAERGFDMLRGILEDPRVDDTQGKLRLRTHASLAFDQTIYSRILQPGKFSGDVMAHTRQEYASAMEIARDASGIATKDRKEALSEGIVVQGLSRQKRGDFFPVICSPREEHGSVRGQNSDYYVLQWKEQTPSKKRMDIKTKFPPSESELAATDSSITLLPVLPILHGIFNSVFPEKSEELRASHPDSSDTAFLHYVATLLIDETRQIPQRSEERQVLGRFGRAIIHELTTTTPRVRRTATPPPRTSKRPLTNNLGDQLRAFLEKE